MIINLYLDGWASYISRCTQKPSTAVLDRWPISFSRHRMPDIKPQLLNKLVAINHEGWGTEQQIQAQQFRPKPKE